MLKVFLGLFYLNNHFLSEKPKKVRTFAVCKVKPMPILCKMRKKILPYALLLGGALGMVSCLGDDEETTLSSACSLLTFSLGNITYHRTITLADDTDSTYSVTAPCSNIEFTIDQAKRLVYNTDSVGYGVPLTAVPVKCAADGTITYQKNGEPTTHSSGDTLDLTAPLVFTITSDDKRYTREYTITVNARRTDPKQSVWTKASPTPDLEACFAQQEALAEDFLAAHPADHAFAFAYPLKTNPNITRHVAVSYNDEANEADTLANVWTRLSTETGWAEIVPTSDNPYGCPRLKNLCVVRYGEDLYAFGGKGLGNRHTPIKAFESMFVSIDHGITWRQTYTDKLSLPAELLGYEGTFRAVADTAGCLWILLPDGTAWKGRMNSLTE